jgi:hypothetical protein
MDIYNLLKNGFDIYDEGKKIDCVIGGINTMGQVWVRMSEDGAEKVKIYDVLGDKIKIVPKS